VVPADGRGVSAVGTSSRKILDHTGKRPLPDFCHVKQRLFSACARPPSRTQASRHHDFVADRQKRPSSSCVAAGVLFRAATGRPRRARN
jgi:hypothetical protein